jgi:hypothetical protein
VSGFWSEIITALATAVLIFIGSRIWKAITKRVIVSNPLETTVGQVVVAVNILIEIAGPQIGATIALLEAAKGNCNSNVDNALEKMQNVQGKFETFKTEAAKCEEVKS